MALLRVSEDSEPLTMAEKIEKSAPAPADDKPRSGLLRQIGEIAVLLLVIFTVKACIVDLIQHPLGLHGAHAPRQ